MMILETWKRLSAFPGGRYLFGRFLAKYVPYTGSVSPEVVELRPGFASLRMRDRRAIRNHLNSVHAAALMNFSEATTGLAFMASIPSDARAILTKFEIEYLKKARGVLTSECETPVATTNESREVIVECVVKNAAGEAVSRAKARWLLGPRPAKGA